MTQSSEDIMKKWAPILGSLVSVKPMSEPGGTLQEEMDRIKSEIKAGNRDGKIDHILMKKRTPILGSLVSVQPMSGSGGISQEEMDRIKSEIKAENRDGKIDHILEGKEFKEKDVTDHPDYKGPILFYLDYKYGGTTSSDTDSGTKTIDKLK